MIDKKYIKVLFSLLGIFLFFNISDNPYKIVRLMRTDKNLYISEYSDGIMKKQVPKKQFTIASLSPEEEKEMDKEFSKLDLDSTVTVLNQLGDEEYPTIMYLFIKDGDTIRSKFFSKSKMPNYLKKIDYLLAKNRIK